MAYAYLFKYIIIGDTGSYIGFSSLDDLLSPLQVLVNRVYYFNSPTSVSNLFMI